MSEKSTWTKSELPACQALCMLSWALPFIRGRAVIVDVALTRGQGKQEVRLPASGFAQMFQQIEARELRC